MPTGTSTVRSLTPLLAIAFLAIALWTEWAAFFSLWYESLIYSHGFIVFVGALFILFKRKDSLRQLRPQVSVFALICLAGSIGALVLAQTADIRFIQLFVTPFVILFWGWGIWGKEFAKTAGGPIMLLLFAAPFWDDFSAPLQHITVFFNEILLNIANVPAEIKEFYIILEVGTFVVEGGCSGIRYLIVGLFLATFYGQLFYTSYRKTISLILFAGLLSMLANWIRVFGIILAGHYTNMETSLVKDHEMFGWGVFVVIALIPILLIAAKLERSNSPKTLKKEQKTNRSSNETRTKYRYIMVACALVLTPAVVPLAVSGSIKEIAQSWRPELFTVNEDWSGPLQHADFWQPAFVNPDIQKSGVYVSEDLERIQAQLVGYRQQDQGKELIYYENSLFDPKEWQLISETTRAIEDNLIPGLGKATETIIRNNQNGITVIIWSWYELGDFRHHSRSVTKLVGALKLLSGDGRGALWAVATQCDGQGDASCSLQRTVLKQFLGDVTSYR
jgi:EpsI family protein